MRVHAVSKNSLLMYMSFAMFNLTSLKANAKRQLLPEGAGNDLYIETHTDPLKPMLDMHDSIPYLLGVYVMLCR
jgi:hypothetical protein